MEKQQFSRLEKLSILTTKWIGTPQSILLHTLFFIVIFALHLFHVNFNDILLILTTVVSLEAIYLSLLIQMTVNRNTASLEAVEEDIDEIQEDVEDIEEDIEDIEEDVDKIHSVHKNVNGNKQPDPATLIEITAQLQKITGELNQLKKRYDK